MGMSGKECHLSAIKHLQELLPVPGIRIVLEPVDERSMLGDEDMRGFRNIFQKSFYPRQHTVGIALDIFFLGIVNDIVQYDHIVIAYAESIVFRAESSPVSGRSVMVSLQVLLVVMVPDSSVKRYPGL